MKPDPRFVGQPKHFWANVRSISQTLGYTVRGSGQIFVPTLEQMSRALDEIGLSSGHIGADEQPSALGSMLHDYFEYRADVLYGFVENQLMDVEAARATYEELRDRYRPAHPPPMNKQKDDKKAPAFF